MAAVSEIRRPLVTLTLKQSHTELGSIAFLAPEGSVIRPELAIIAEQLMEQALGVRCHIHVEDGPDDSLRSKTGGDSRHGGTQP